MQLSPKLEWSLAAPKWAATLNPLLSNPLNDIHIISNYSLINGVNVINHGLGHNMQGWFLSDIQGAATVYRSAPFNHLTLTLTSSAAVTVSIGVF